MPEAWRAICLRKREARPSADAEGAENGERLRRRRRREDDRGLRASGSAWARGRCTTARGGCGARSRTPRPRRAEPRGKAMPARSPPNGRSSTWPSFRRSRTMPASRGSSRRSSGRTPSTRRGSSSPPRVGSTFCSASRTPGRPARRRRPSRQRAPPRALQRGDPACRRCGREDDCTNHGGSPRLHRRLPPRELVRRMPALASGQSRGQPHGSGQAPSFLSARPRPPLARGCRARDGARGRLRRVVRLGVVAHAREPGAAGRGARQRPLGHRP